MTPITALHALNNYIKFSDKEMSILQKVAVIRHYKKREEVLAFGEREQYISCVTKGLVRKHIM